MRFWGRTVLIALLVASLAQIPALAAAAKPIGVITASQSARLDSAGAAVGSTVYAGDKLETDVGGSLRLRVAGAQLYLLSDSVASVRDAASGLSASVTRGWAGFASAGQPAELRANDAILRATSGEDVHAQLRVLSPTEMIVRSVRGALTLEFDGATHAIASGEAYDVRIESAPAQESNGSGTVPTERSHRKLLMTIVKVTAIAGGTILGVWIIHELSESPSKVDDF